MCYFSFLLNTNLGIYLFHKTTTNKYSYYVVVDCFLLCLDLVERSLKEITDFFHDFSNSNTFEGEYYDFQLRRKPIFVIELSVRDSDILFLPNNTDTFAIIMEVIDEIVNSAVDIPRVRGNKY